MIDNIYKPNIILEEVFPSEAEEKRNNKCKNMLNHFFFNPQWRYPEGIFVGNKIEEDIL